MADELNLPKGFLSPTQIEMYWRCPKQYEYRYIKGIKTPPVVNLVEGGRHHFTLQKNNEYKIKTGSDRSEKYLTELFSDSFSDEAKEIPRKEWRLAETSKDKVIKRGRIIQKNYRKNFAQKLQPKMSEVEVRFKIGSVEVLGYIDVIGKYTNKSACIKFNGVMDYKVVGRAKKESDAMESIQLAHYGWGSIDLIKGVSFKKPPHVGFCSLLKTGNMMPYLIYVPLLAERIKWYRQQVAEVARAISAGVFPCRNSIGWECSEKFCGYYSRCRGKVWKG